MTAWAVKQRSAHVERRTLTADEVFGANDLPRKWVSIPEWADGDDSAGLYVRGMTVGEHGVLADIVQKGGGRSARGTQEYIAATCCVDEQGNPVFAAEHAARLAGKASVVLERIAATALSMSGVSMQDLLEDEESEGND